jgi:hypothetical protein
MPAWFGDAGGAVQRGFVQRRTRHSSSADGRRVQSICVPQGIQSDGVNEVNLTLLQRMPPREWPPSAREVLLKALRNGRLDEAERLTAARLAGEVVVMNDEVADILLAIVGDAAASAALRAQAALSLGPGLESMDWDEEEGFLALAIVDRPISTRVFHRIREVLHASYRDDGVPKEVRRRILEASVRAPERWHRDAIHEAYSLDDREWRLTAVFGMQYVLGFDDQIVEALNDADADIRHEAIRAAGIWELEAAWPPVAAMLASQATEKRLLIAAIEAGASICPREAISFLSPLCNSEDAQIAEASREAVLMAKGAVEHGLDEDSDEDFDEDTEPEEPW